jgi:uncharacterized membrane protein YccC
MTAALPLRAFGPFIVPAAITDRGLLFAVSTAFSALLALYLAFWFQLESPSWAATTVMIVAQPVPGQVVGKGFYRAIGTVTGAVAAVVLTGLFAQMPELFIAGMAAWIAGCTYVSILLRGFRSYGAVLAGYTAAIVAFGTGGQPSMVFDVAVARSSAILLGILCAASVSALLIPGTARADLMVRLRAALDAAVELANDVAAGRTGRETRRRIVREIAAVEGLSDAAQAEALDFRRRMGSVAVALGELFSILSALRAIEEHVGRIDPDWRELHLAWLRARLAPDLAAFDARRAAVTGEPSPATNAPAPETAGASPPAIDSDRITRTVLEQRAADVVIALNQALEAYGAIAGRNRSALRGRIVHHRDPAQARRNALRAFLAVALAGAFWIASAWPAGAGFVANVGIICSLFAAQDRPSAAGTFFLKGILVALPLAFLWRFFILPWGEGYSFLVFVLAPPIILGALAFVNPGTARIATSFNVYFLSLVGPTNEMSYDPAGFIDSAGATLVGIGIGIMMFSLVLPTDPMRLARRILDRIRRDIAAVATRPGRAERHGFETLVYDRLTRIFALSADETLLAGGVAALGVALEIDRLKGEPLAGEDRRAVDGVIARIAGALRDEPAPGLDRELDEVRSHLMSGPSGTEDAGTRLRAAAALGMIADARADHPALFGREGNDKA